MTIHQSLQSHPNIVTLHRALETDSLLILVLEYVPGEDLYYFLEQQRDRRLSLISGVGTGSETTTKVGSGSDEYEDVGDDTLVDQNEDAEDEDEDARGRRRSRALHNLRHPRVPTSASTSSSAKSDVDSPSTSDDEREQGQEVSGKGAGAGTPPTPSLLSSVHPQTMLSFGRLKLIASMFGQMCDAVQVRFSIWFRSGVIRLLGTCLLGTTFLILPVLSLSGALLRLIFTFCFIFGRAWPRVRVHFSFSRVSPPSPSFCPTPSAQRVVILATWAGQYPLPRIP